MNLDFLHCKAFSRVFVLCEDLGWFVCMCVAGCLVDFLQLLCHSFQCKKKVIRFRIPGGMMTVWFLVLEKWLTVWQLNHKGR